MGVRFPYTETDGAGIYISISGIFAIFQEKPVQHKLIEKLTSNTFQISEDIDVDMTFKG